jgi:hypothetical protein
MTRKHFLEHVPPIKWEHALALKNDQTFKERNKTQKVWTVINRHICKYRVEQKDLTVFEMTGLMNGKMKII